MLERCSDRYSKDYFSTPEASGDDPTGPTSGIMSMMEYKITIPSSSTNGDDRSCHPAGKSSSSPSRSSRNKKKYKLSGKVCTMNYGQRLVVAVGPPPRGGDGGDGMTPPDDGVPIKLSFTLGEWQIFGETSAAGGGGDDPDDTVILELVEGEENSIYIWRDHPPQYGVSIKEFVLTPLP